MNQETLFTVQDASGRLKPVVDNNTPLLHHKVAGNANSAIAYEKHKASQFHIVAKLRIKAFLFANQGSTLDEISAGTGIIQKGTITGRFENLRQDGYDLIDNHGRWSLKKRIT